MSRLRALVAAALTLGALAVPRAGAATEIVLTGSRSGYVDVELTNPLYPYAPTVETRGRFGGYYAVPLTSPFEQRRPFDGGWVAVRGMSPDPDALDPMALPRPPDVGPGKVRFYLIADGPTTVRIPANSGRGGTYRVTPGRVHAQVRTAPLVQRGDVWSADTAPLRVAPRSPSIAAVRVSGDLSGLSTVAVCIRKAGEVCEARQPASSTATGNGTLLLGSEQRWESGTTATPTGTVTGSATVDPLQPIRGGLLAAFVLTLPAK